ncbi:MAG: aminotransferase class V-fold PLP-dependent enzyme [Alphaproteobacteria bacterium]|nr:MAG: aminotransferase class V-fold PLP-dependent enzyme [Alphaproteobacteria bacterium]
MSNPWRPDFPIFTHSVYLNSCSYGALSRRVEAAYEAYLENRHAKGADWIAWCEKNEIVRGQLAQLIGAEPAEIAVTTSASAALDSLVSALSPSGERNRIVISDFEFPTVGQIWHAQEGRGFEVVTARERDGIIPMSEYERLIDERTLIVSIAHVCYRNGAMNDVAAIARLAHERGALVLLDAYQALGAVPVDVRALGVDFLIGGVLKYLLSSAGVGLLYVRGELVPGLSPYATGWFAQADIHAMDMHHHREAPDARRFETGTPPIPNLFAAEAGLAQILEIGVETIHAHVRPLTARLKAGVKDLGGRLASPEDPARHGAMIAIRSSDDHGLVARLAARRIVTSCRDGNLRVSPHFYNTEEDIDALLAALADNRDLLA